MPAKNLVIGITLLRKLKVLQKRGQQHYMLKKSNVGKIKFVDKICKLNNIEIDD